MPEEHKQKPEGADKPDNPKPDDRKNPENTQAKMSERLDDALEDTFPSSDPVSVKITK